MRNIMNSQQLEVVICTDGISGRGIFKKVCTYESFAVMPENHPLAAKKELTLDEIFNESLITLPPKCISFQKENKFQEYLTPLKMIYVVAVFMIQ